MQPSRCTISRAPPTAQFVERQFSIRFQDVLFLYQLRLALSTNEECRRLSTPTNIHRPNRVVALQSPHKGCRPLGNEFYDATKLPRKHMTRSTLAGTLGAAESPGSYCWHNGPVSFPSCQCRAAHIFNNKISSKYNAIQECHDKVNIPRQRLSCSRVATVCLLAPRARHTRRRSPFARGRECARSRPCSRRPQRDKNPALSRCPGWRALTAQPQWRKTG